MIKFLRDKELYDTVIQNYLPKSSRYLWIATSDLKDMYVSESKRMVPFLSILNKLITKRVELRLLHAKEPGPNFRKDYDRFPLLWKAMEMMHCPRVHLKSIIIDGKYAYIGSANLTGAGLGAKSSNRRNFECGILTDEESLLEKISQQFDEIWMGKFCKDCARTEFCNEKMI